MSFRSSRANSFHWYAAASRQSTKRFLFLTPNHLHTMTTDTIFVPRAKPCPFCGYTKMAYNRTPGGNTTWVVCYKCEANGPFGDSLRSALIRWNRRRPSVREKI